MAGISNFTIGPFINATTGQPYAGARAAFFESSTNTPITVYQDYGLGTEHSNPVLADSGGRFPPIFIDEAVGFYRLRITTASGSVLPLGDGGSFDLPILPVIGPSSGEGGGSEVAVDANALLQVGEFFWKPVNTTRAGCVRSNGRTIGSASSGASERANDDCEDAYVFLWGSMTNAICPVTGGRGISALSDFAANKPIATLDMRGRGPFGLADMGNSTSTIFNGVTFSAGSATVAGSSAGLARTPLTVDQLPVFTPAGTVTMNPTGFLRSDSNSTTNGTASNFNFQNPSGNTVASLTFAGTPMGGGESHTNLSPVRLGSWFMKLAIGGLLVLSAFQGGIA